MKIISVKGIVVSTTPFKETSKIINIFTENMGVIGCISKGCKNLKSKLRLPSEKFAYGTFHLYYNEKGLSTLIEGDIENYFLNIKSDILRISYLSYICELAVYVYNYDSYIKDGFGKRRICDIKYSDIKKFYYSLMFCDFYANLGTLI